MNQEERDQNQAAATGADNTTSAAAGNAQGSGATTGRTESQNDESTDLERDLEEARSKAQTYLDLAQRTQADFLNYKRRIEQERGEYARSARGETIGKILPLLDDLERATRSIPPDLANSDWVQGIVLIGRKLQSTLQSLGVKQVGEVGKQFDPWQEEAIMYEPSSQYPAGTVTQVVQAGYTLDGKVLRPAQVIVSSGPPPQVTQ